MKIFKKIRHQWHLNRFGHYYPLKKLARDLASDKRYPLFLRVGYEIAAKRYRMRGMYHFEEYLCRDIGGDLEIKMRKVFRENEVKGL